MSELANNTPADVYLDARHMLCPMPVIKVQQAISAMTNDQTLKVVGTDPGVQHDIPAWVRVHQHELIDSHVDEDSREYFFTIRVCK